MHIQICKSDSRPNRTNIRPLRQHVVLTATKETLMIEFAVLKMQVKRSQSKSDHVCDKRLTNILQ